MRLEVKGVEGGGGGRESENSLKDAPPSSQKVESVGHALLMALGYRSVLTYANTSFSIIVFSLKIPKTDEPYVYRTGVTITRRLGTPEGCGCKMNKKLKPPP